jgi:hypothetical protein
VQSKMRYLAGFASQSSNQSANNKPTRGRCRERTVTGFGRRAYSVWTFRQRREFLQAPEHIANTGT